ncbi:hypothetical protein N7G274_009840 [Stereocaulon virgatum]|uniref:Uncharacterized protein n=1 Tax=Stereocaulon virgatum TaxID=373712 RepID=A0ABR3ZUS4_9LECA
MSGLTQSSGSFHLPYLLSKRGMKIFKEIVRPNVQPHNDDDTWFQNQYEQYLQLARVYQSHNIPDQQWRFEIVRDGTHDHLQIPPSLLAEQQQANSFALVADPHVAQQGHQMTIRPSYRNATYQNAHFNSNALQLNGHFNPTTSGYSNILYGQIDSNSGLSDSSKALNPHAEEFRHPAGAARRNHSLRAPVTQTATSDSPDFSSSSQQRQSAHHTPLVRGPQTTNSIGPPARSSSAAQGEQCPIDNDIATAAPLFGLDAFAAEQRRYYIISPQVEARHACRPIAPALHSTYSPENAPPLDGEHSTLPYGGGQLSPSQNPDGTRKLYIPPFRWTQIQDRRPNGLHNSSKDTIGSRQASKSPSRAQSPYVFSPTPKSSRLANVILKFENLARGQSEEHMNSTAATTPPTPAPPVVLNQVRAAPANARKGLRVTDIEAARAIARKKEKEDLFAGSIVEERVLARRAHTYGPIARPCNIQPPKERQLFGSDTESRTSGETNFSRPEPDVRSAFACPTLA